jgi:hypothetical protein
MRAVTLVAYCRGTVPVEYEVGFENKADLFAECVVSFKWSL